MNTGMLWFDNSKLPLSDKIRKAMDYYTKKYGLPPQICLVNPKDFKEVEIEGLQVDGYRPVLPGHLWMGQRDE